MYGWRGYWYTVIPKDDGPALSTVKKVGNWISEGKAETNSGRFIIVGAKENIDCFHQTLRDNRQIIINQISNTISTSRVRAENIRQNELSMSKISARWLKRLLTLGQKNNPLITWRKKLTLFESDQPVFLVHFVSPDASWDHHGAFWPTTSHLLDMTFVFWVWMLFSNISWVWSSEHCWHHRYALFNRILRILFFVNYFFCEDQLQVWDGK